MDSENTTFSSHGTPNKDALEQSPSPMDLPQQPSSSQEDASQEIGSKSYLENPIYPLTKSQVEIFMEFKDIITKHETLKQYAQDDLLIHKFLHAREWKIPKALEMWLHREKLVKKYNMYGLELDENIRFHASHGKAFVYGKDKENHPIVVIKSDALFRFANHHKVLNISYDEYIERSFVYMLYLCEYALKQEGVNPDRKVSIIYDRLLHSVSLFSVISHLKLLKRIASLNDIYPEFLHKMYIIRHNGIFQAGWKVFSAFLHPNTASKVMLLDSVVDLQNYIDKDQLLRTMGGPGNLNPIPECARIDYEMVPKNDIIYQDWVKYSPK